MPRPGEAVLDQNTNDPAEETADEQIEGEIVEPSNEPIDETEGEESEVSESESDDGDAEEPAKRPVYTMPVAKAQEEKRKAVEKAVAEAKAEAEEDMRRLREEFEKKSPAQQEKSDLDTELQQVAEEHGLDPNAAKRLLDVFKKAVPTPDLSKYDEIIKEREIAEHKTKVSQEFDDKVAPLILKDFPQATPEHIRQVKERVAELAFSRGYHTYRLEDIYKVNRDEFEFKNGYSAEPSGGRTTQLSDFSKLSDAQENELASKDPAAYGRYLKWLDGQESKFIS